MEKLTDKQKLKIEEEVKMMLHASRDCLRNQNIDTRKISFHANDGYFGEAFGIMRTLNILNYGYFGSSNLDAIKERRGDLDYQNLKWWFSQLEYKVLEEEGFQTDNICNHCRKKYGKDSTIFDNKE